MERIMVDKGIYLQEPTTDDASKMLALLKDDMPNLLDIFEWAKLDYSLNDEISSMANLNGKDLLLYIYYNNSPCGKICFYDYNAENNFANLYVYIASPYRHKDIAYKSVWASLGYAFNNLGINEILFFINENNKKSLNLASRMGFKEEGLLQNQDFINGQYHNQYLLSFSAKDYKEIFEEINNGNDLACKTS